MPDYREALKILGVELYPENMPQWAMDLTDKVCEDYKILTPKIVWKYRNSRSSSGTSWNHEATTKYSAKQQITIRKGQDLDHAQLVLLHELAHQIVPQGEHHSETFWKMAYALYRRYGPSLGWDLRWAYEIEKNYKDMARTIGAEFLAGIW